MNLKHLLLVLTLFPVISLCAHAGDRDSFWESRPKALAERYMNASESFHEDWVPGFADSLDALGRTEEQYRLYAAELRCHRAFNQRDSADFFKYSEEARAYALKFQDLPMYFGELFNVYSFHINTGKSHEAQKAALFLISESSRLDFPNGAYYGYYAMGLLFSRMGAHSHAIKSLNNALDVIEDEPRNIYAAATIYETIADEYLQLKDFSKSIEYGLKAREIDDTGDVDATLATAYFFKGDYDAFHSACDSYLSRTGNSSIAYEANCCYLRCLQSALNGDYKSAGEYADMMDDDTRNLLYSEICKMKGDWKGAYEHSLQTNKDMLMQRDSLMMDEIEQLESDIMDITTQHDRSSQVMRRTFLFIIVFVIVLAVIILAVIYTMKNRAILRHKEKELRTTRRYMTMIENSPMGFSRARLIYDSETGEVADYRTMQVNSKLRRPLLASGIAIGGRTIMESYPKSGPELIRQINEAREQNLPYVRFLFHLKEFHKYYETIIFFDSKEIISILSLNTTDTIRAKKDAIHANEVKTRFIQNMSHEIRTPLNAILGFAQLLSLPAEYTTDAERQEYNSIIANNSDMLLMLIDDIIEIADIDNGHYKMNIAPASPNKIARYALKAVEYRVKPGVKLLFSSDVGDTFMTDTDAKRVQQVLINFLTNAAKNTANGQITLAISTTENPGRVTFSVADTGVGVPPEMAEEIFERFTKLDEFKQGAGLGLNICKNIATELGACVKLDQTYSDGARFLLIL